MTIRQKNRARIIGKNRTAQAELLEAGYAPSTAKKQPPTVMKAKGWLKLMDKYLPDNDLLVKHKEALNAVKQIGAQILIDKNGETITKENEGMIEVPDQAIRLKAVELGYRVKGKLRPEEGVSNEVKILVIPSELIKKYDTTITPNTSDSSAG